MEREVTGNDLEARARELYKADQAKFVTPEQVYVQQILVGLSGRTRDQALERAQQVFADAKAGKEDFLALAARYSDDPDVKRHGGDLGYNGKDSFPPPVAKAIAAASKKGEVMGPIEGERGFYVMRFIDRKKPEAVKFEAVRKKLIEAEREKLNKQRLQDLMASIRETGVVVVHPENVEKLVVPVDLAKLQKASEAPAAPR
jgi:parvulin-like peptidyl-prolyl isomerase